jgi:hypothetical protein
MREKKTATQVYISFSRKNIKRSHHKNVKMLYILVEYFELHTEQ